MGEDWGAQRGRSLNSAEKNSITCVSVAELRFFREGSLPPLQIAQPPPRNARLVLTGKSPRGDAGLEPRTRRSSGFFLDAVFSAIKLKPALRAPVAVATCHSRAKWSRAQTADRELPMESIPTTESCGGPSAAAIAKPAGHRLPPPAATSKRVVLTYLIPFVIYHAAIPLAFVPWLFSWSGLLLIPLLHFVFDWVGVGLCFHRTLTHGGLVLPKWLEHIFVVFGLCNLMDSPARWVAIHRKHHQHTDKQPDPHTPLVNLWWGHMGWLLRVNEETSRVEFYHRYAPDILRDPFYLNIERYRLWATVYFIHVGLVVAAGFVSGWLWSAHEPLGPVCSLP